MEADDIHAILVLLQQLFDPTGFDQGLGAGIVFMGGFWIWRAMRSTWGERDE